MYRTNLKPYTMLSKVYSQYWGDFCLGYLQILNHIKKVYQFDFKSVLDVSCGTGELIRNLYSRKYVVVGSDISENMISIARKRSTAEKIDFFVEDMADIKLNRKFDIVVCSFDSINYIINQDHLQRVFVNIYKHLNEGGYFVFDTITPMICPLNINYCICKKEDSGINVTQIQNYDSINNLLETTFRFDNMYFEKHIQRTYSKNDIVSLLKKSTNFKVSKTINDFNFRSIKNYSRIFFITKKY